VHVPKALPAVATPAFGLTVDVAFACSAPRVVETSTRRRSNMPKASMILWAQLVLDVGDIERAAVF
jgi:hypothetical protein